MGAAVVNQQGEVIGEVQDAVTLGSRIVRTVEGDVSGMNLKGFSWRTVEKLLSYGAGIVAATNGFAQLSMPNTVRDALMAVSALVVASLHVSGPAATPNHG